MARARYKKRKDGRYLAQIPTGEYYEDKKGKLKPKLINVYAHTQAELDLNIAETRKQIETGLIIQDKNITVKEWAERWLKAYKGGHEYKTREMYAGAIRKHIIPRLGPAKMRNVRQHQLQELLNMKSNELDEDGKLVNGKRVLEILQQTLKQIFRKATDEQIIAVDPARNIKVHQKVRKQSEEKRAFTILEDKLFLQLADKHEHGLFFKLLYYTGLRPEEARALVMQDVDLEHDKLTVDEAVIFERDKPVLKGCKSKASVRVLPIPAPLKAALRAHRPPQGTILFPGAHGRFMTRIEYKRMYESFDKALNELAGGKDKVRAVDRFTPKVLRHNYATMMAEAGIPPKYLMYLMGHSEIETTMKYYVHVSERQRIINEQKIKRWAIFGTDEIGANQSAEN